MCVYAAVCTASPQWLIEAKVAAWEGVEFSIVMFSARQTGLHNLVFAFTCIYVCVCTCACVRAHTRVCMCVYFHLSYPVGRTSKRQNTDQELHHSAHSFFPSELSLSIESSQHWAFVWGVDPCTNKPSVCRLLEWDWCLYSRPALPLYRLLCVSLTDCRVSLFFFWLRGCWGAACRGP